MDLERFEMVTKNAAMAAGIKHIRFKPGTITNLVLRTSTRKQTFSLLARFFAFDISFHVMRRFKEASKTPYESHRCTADLRILSLDTMECDCRIELIQIRCSAVRKTQMRKNSAIQEYAEWNTRWHAANQNYQELFRLKAMFIRLKALDRIDISFKASPFKSDLLWSAWTQGNSSKDFNRRVKQFMNLLLALQGTSFQLKHLTHDKLPVTFCTLRDNVLRKLIGPLQHLSTLRLTFDAATVPHSRFWNGLGQSSSIDPKFDSSPSWFCSI
jgi:hypothetical protein